MAGSRSFSPRALYCRPLVLKNRFTGRPLAASHRASSSRVGLSSLMSRFWNEMPFSTSQASAFLQVEHLG